MYWMIGLGGVAGTFARFGVQGVVDRLLGGSFPWGTLVVNVTGSLAVGILARLGADAAALTPEVRAGLLIGFCGAYTTFSTYSLDTVQLVQGGAWGRAAAYAAGSALLSLAATMAGIAVADRLP